MKGALPSYCLSSRLRLVFKHLLISDTLFRPFVSHLDNFFAMSQRITSEKVDVSPLEQPLEFLPSGKKAPNRFLKAAMTERLSSWDPKELTPRGIPSKELVNVYKRWGEGALGTILTGNIMQVSQDTSQYEPCC